MYALHQLNDEERSHDGKWLVAVSDDLAKLEEKAVEVETERLREDLEHDALEGLEPVAELSWADWGMPGTTWSVALVPFGRFEITETDLL